MNRKLSLTLAVLASAVIGNAFADDISIDPTPFKSTRTRAEVQAELQEFRASGVDPWADNYSQQLRATSEKSRAEVRAEYLAERDKVAAFTGEDSGSVWLARVTPTGPQIQMAGEPFQPILY
jgi:K+-transporting ATPase c subunit